ncbi:MAG: GtrA family protein [Roseivirga sp.]|nr:GtrA family protein [Roseivirga sp.]
MALKFLKFCVVGSLGLGIDFGITFLSKEKARWNKYIANSLGFISAATSNFFINKYWTFQDTNPDQLVQYSKYILIALIGLAINNLIIYLLINKREMKFYWAKLVAVGVVVLWNFIANYNFTFTS